MGRSFLSVDTHQSCPLLHVSGFAGWDSGSSLRGLTLTSQCSPYHSPHASMGQAGIGQNQRVAGRWSGPRSGVQQLQLPINVLGLTGQMKPFVPANGPFLAVMERSCSVALLLFCSCGHYPEVVLLIC